LIVLDTSGLYAAVYPGEPGAAQVRAVLEADDGPLVLSPFVLCEIDYLIASRARRPNLSIELLQDVNRGAYELAHFGFEQINAALGVLRRYADLRVGLTDASLVVLAEQYETNRVLTLDERHFRVLRTAGGDAFTLLPADA
jgi:predicted nucleic acid-binding protein